MDIFVIKNFLGDDFIMTNLSKKLCTTLLAFSILGSYSFAKSLKVGASAVPHAEILQAVKPQLKEKGLDLEIIEFNEYVTPNLALASGDLDANFFQHAPYLEKFRTERNLKISQIGEGVFISPIAAFSDKYKSLDEVKKGGVVAIPSDPTNGGRALLLLHHKGIITLKDPTDLSATEFDIIKNPKKLKFKSIEAPQLPRVIKDVDVAVINCNYALQAKLDPTKDSIAIEGPESPYANIVAVRDENINDPDVKLLVDELRTENIKNFINETYKGSVIAAF